MTEGRLAAASLTLFPVLTVVLLLAVDPGTRAALQNVTGVAILGAAVALVAAGAYWLWRIAEPPFTAFPHRRSILERQPQTAFELSVILHQAARYAGDGAKVVDALDRVAPDEASHPSRVLTMGLRVLLATQDEGPTEDDDVQPKETVDVGVGASRSGVDEVRAELPGWLIATLQPGWTDNDPVETLSLVASGIQAELRAAAAAWPGRVRVAALAPFTACILPAVILLASLTLL